MKARRIDTWLVKPPKSSVNLLSDMPDPEDGTDSVWSDLALSHPMTVDQDKDANDAE